MSPNPAAHEVPAGMDVHRPAGAWLDAAIVVHRLGWRDTNDPALPGPLTRLVAALTTRGVAVVTCEIQADRDGDRVRNLIADAVSWLEDRARRPRWLIGHGPGTEPVLRLAASRREIGAVVLLNAEMNASTSSTEVPDVDSAEFARLLEAIDHPLLVLHGTHDAVTPITEMTALLDRSGSGSTATRSFVAVDRGDHDLGDPVAAACAAEMIAAWLAGHVDPDHNEHHHLGPVVDRVTVAESNLGLFHSQVVAGDHRFVADEPLSFGGFDAGPSPYDLLAAALGACTSMTVRMYADRKGIALDRVEVGVSHDQVHANDAGEAGGDGEPGGVVATRGPRLDRFRRTIALEGNLEPEIRARLAEIANRCPVHRTLERSAIIETGLLEPESQSGGLP